VTIRLSRARPNPAHLVVPPIAPGKDPFRARPGEERLIRRAHAAGAVVHSACLGSIVLARCGILDGQEATTHWAWAQAAAERFPAVRWDARRMLVDAGGVVTAGGFLAAVDLALALVERVASRALSRELGRRLLADSVRQHQSGYATTLVSPRVEDGRLRRLEAWLDANLSSPVTVDEMAKVCHLGVRTFHRVFAAAYGCTPKKLLQTKRIEKVRRLLRDPNLSVEQAIARVGVHDVPSFRKVFRRELGLSPAEYRKRLRAA
jgi:transcriptional regulator GlxA family with amidase domain